MTINIFVLKGELNGKNRSGAFLFLSGIVSLPCCIFSLYFLSFFNLLVCCVPLTVHPLKGIITFCFRTLKMD